jgi:hypothetical protein
VEKTKYVLQFEQNYSATWFNGGFVRIMAKKHLRENPFTNDKLFAETGYICAEKKIRVDDCGACSLVVSPWFAEIHKAGRQGTG